MEFEGLYRYIQVGLVFSLVFPQSYPRALPLLTFLSPVHLLSTTSHPHTASRSSRLLYILPQVPADNQDWHGIFQRFDKDASGLIDRKELHQALLGFGFSLPTEMVRKLEKRFAPPPKLLPGGQVEMRKGISFDRFLMACVTVKHYTEGFRR